MNTAVQTSANAPSRLRGDCAIDLTGILLHAEVAMRPLGDGTFVPAVVMELEHVGAGHHHVVAHVLYARDAHAEAEAKVKRLRRGDSITVRTALADLRLLLPAADFPHETP